VSNGWSAVSGRLTFPPPGGRCRLHRRTHADTPDELWLTAHPPVFTQGQAGKPEHLLRDIGIPVVKIDRGGQITYHGPGQAVAYLLVDLSRRGLKVRELVNRIEQAVIDCSPITACAASAWPARRASMSAAPRSPPSACASRRLLLPWRGAQRGHGSCALFGDQPLRLCRAESHADCATLGVAARLAEPPAAEAPAGTTGRGRSKSEQRQTASSRRARPRPRASRSRWCRPPCR
jgi:hypothetical protein